MRSKQRKNIITGAWLGLCLLLAGCSWSIPFFIVNTGPQSRTVTINLLNDARSFLLFNPRFFRMVPWKDDEPDFEAIRDFTQPFSKTIQVEIPPHTALEIGHLNNQNYENSRQKFINGRVFNLVSVESGKAKVTRDTFDAHFKKIVRGYAWVIPD